MKTISLFSPSAQASKMETLFPTYQPDTHGPLWLDNGAVLFRIWAPGLDRLALDHGGQCTPTRKMAGGWFQLERMAVPGDLYTYIADGNILSDYAAPAQPQGPLGPSQLIAPSRRGRPQPVGAPWARTVNYEMHMGAFSSEGTYDGARKLLPELVQLGITNIQVMPLAAFDGGRGWGYDGTHLFALYAPYGTTEQLENFIDEAHRLDLTVTLDVVYNHFGPVGNNLAVYAPQAFTDHRPTPWGAALAYDDPDNRPLRDLIIQHALHALHRYGFDGLRFDAVHEIHSDDFMRELATRLRESLPAGRTISLLMESEDVQPDLLRRDNGGRVIYYDAVIWDKPHHAAHVLATGEVDGYYKKYMDNPLGWLGKSMTLDLGEKGKEANVPAQAFLIGLSNHDQAGNRARGERLHQLASRYLLQLQALFLLSPKIYMFFNGEEWGTQSPFPFFSHHEGEVARATREGRLNEFKKFAAFATPEGQTLILDPNADNTYMMAKLDWQNRTTGEHAAQFELYRQLISIHKREILPLTGDNPVWRPASFKVTGHGILLCEWGLDNTHTLRSTVNFSQQSNVALTELEGRQIFGDTWPEDRRTLLPGAVHICIVPASASSDHAAE
jgi:maltooligosyltrehalose trehalohydrolase